MGRLGDSLTTLVSQSAPGFFCTILASTPLDIVILEASYAVQGASSQFLWNATWFQNNSDICNSSVSYHVVMTSLAGDVPAEAVVGPSAYAVEGGRVHFISMLANLSLDIFSPYTFTVSAVTAVGESAPVRLVGDIRMCTT